LPIHRYQEEARLFERLQASTRVVASQEGVAQRCAQPFEHRCADQEVTIVSGEAVEDLPPEIVGDVAVAPAERRESPFPSRHDQRKLEAGDPSFEVGVQLVHGLLLHRGIGLAEKAR
jgi:hypothetical protein